ncbi:uncharacterized protein JCM10292_007114 [Rhodotorula paludigena]|uniref:uncharacterized protein n=1 Tax=Rhodotorula paludigena TaxID=86838 RepID=UPI0031795FA1
MDSDDDGYSSTSESEFPLSLPVLTPALASSSSATPAHALAPKPAKSKGKQSVGPKGDKDSGGDKEPRKRSSKACDNCRKSKCKCTRILDPATSEPVGPCQNCITVGAECTFLGASRKRGPPKGYIEAIESRLHRMEALLGGLLGSDDPRAATLLGELIGDNEARDILARDLRAAAAPASASSGPPKRSWKREFAEAQQQQIAAQASQTQPGQPQQPTILATGFPTQPGEPAFPGGLGGSVGGSNWLSEEDLGGFGGAGTGGVSAEPYGVNSLGLDPSTFGLDLSNGAAGGSFPGAAGQYRAPGQQGESSEDGASPNFLGVGTSSAAFSLPIGASTILDGAGSSAAGGPRLSTSASATADLSTSPRQRRRLDIPTYGTSPTAGGSGGSPSSGGVGGQGYLNPDRKQMAYAFTLPPVGVVPPRSSNTAALSVLSPSAIGHTGTSSYTLSSGDAGGTAGGDAIMTAAPTAGGAGGKGKGTGAATTGEDMQSPKEPMSELADVVGQLSLNENAEVRYHGRSSGLYLISKSQRFRDFFWQFPSAGVWPPADNRVLKTEREILQLADAEDPLPDMSTQTHLLSAYWTYVHPHFPLLYKVSFMRQYRHSLAHPHSTEPSTPAGTGKVPMVLLLSMFALAARYCDLEEARKDGKYWTAGQEYLDKARRILNHDYGSSKLVTVQALLLISYREIGVGAMSSAWMTNGMAIRMAQDLGLFRDVEKWFLPIQRFTHEEKQTRKRIWWACVILDRYTSSYIGRPGTIHERDYDCGFPSEDEPDEHEQWRPIRVDGTEWTSNAKAGSDPLPEENAKFLKAYPPTRAHTLSCFNAAGALAVIINRIISNIYAIRIRVLGQSSETLLSLLDQSLASWYLALPTHLQYNPASKKVPPPHILSLHLQFYSSLILLHRPFIPGQNSTASPGNFPSHSICTTSANAIANIITTWRKTFTLRQCPPFLTYPIFSAAIICVYNASFDEALARPAKVHLLQCMHALKEMELIWGSAIRQWELLHGLVDLRDAELNAELDGLARAERGTKRPTMEVDSPAPGSAAFDGLQPTNFHNRPMGGRAHSKTAVGRKRSSTSASRGAAAARSPVPGASAALASPPLGQHQHQLGYPGLPPVLGAMHSPPLGSFPGAGPNFPLAGVNQVGQPGSMPPGLPGDGTAQTFDILNPSLDLSQFKSPPGTSGGTTNYSDLLNSFLSPTEVASTTGANPFIFGAGGNSPFGLAMAAAAAGASPNATSAAPAVSTSAAASLPGGGMPASTAPTPFDPTSAFFGMPLGANLGDDWFNYSYSAFAATGSDQGGTPDSQTAALGASAGASAQTPAAPSGQQMSPKPPTM